MASSLANENQRQVYLITYSRADTEKCPTKERFAEAVQDAWHHCGVRVKQWVVCMEAHADSDIASTEMRNAYHYHMAIKLTKRTRWLQVKNYLARMHGIQVHFSDNHTCYYSAYSYVTKEDTEALHSVNHPDLKEPPQTERAISVKKNKAKLRRNGTKGK